MWQNILSSILPLSLSLSGVSVLRRPIQCKPTAPTDSQKLWQSPCDGIISGILFDILPGFGPQRAGELTILEYPVVRLRAWGRFVKI